MQIVLPIDAASSLHLAPRLTAEGDAEHAGMHGAVLGRMPTGSGQVQMQHERATTDALLAAGVRVCGRSGRRVRQKRVLKMEKKQGGRRQVGDIGNHGNLVRNHRSNCF